MHSLKRYLTIYIHLVLFSLKGKLEYRWNFVVQMLYAPAYVFILFLLMKLAFANAPVIAGWNYQEGMVLFSSFHLMASISNVTLLTSVRDLLWSGLRQGNLDMILTKPINTQLYATFYKPEIQQLPLSIGLFIIFLYSLSQLSSLPSFIHFFWFAIFWLLGLVLNYLTITTYITLGFFVVRAQQIIELYDKISDHGQYPVTMFPASIQWVAFSIDPIAFMSFVPVSMLLGRADWRMFLGPIVVACILFFVNQKAWKWALKAYSSASS